MLYDGACECIERPIVDDSNDFLLALAAALMEEPILLSADEQSQTEQYLADECAENDADQARLAEYLAELALEDGQEFDYVVEDEIGALEGVQQGGESPP